MALSDIIADVDEYIDTETLVGNIRDNEGDVEYISADGNELKLTNDVYHDLEFILEDCESLFIVGKDGQIELEYVGVDEWAIVCDGN